MSERLTESEIDSLERCREFTTERSARMVARLIAEVRAARAAKPVLWTRWAAIYDDSPDNPHLFDTEEKAVGMLGVEPGRVVAVEVVAVVHKP